MKKLEQVVSAAQRALEDPANLLELVNKHHCRSDPFDVHQFVQVLPRKLHTQLWESLHRVALKCSEELPTTAELENDTAAKETLELMAAVCTFVRGALCMEKPPLHDMALLDTLGIFHDMVLCVPEEGLQLQTEIVGLCEAWWRADLPERDRLVPHTISFLLASSLYGTATLPLVKRVYSMKAGLLALEFEDASADSLKSLLLTCFIHPTYIKSQEGLKFLSFVFGLQPAFISDIHQTIKNHIPGCPKAYLEGYGQVYLKAWKAASGVYRQVIEEKCLQDLMYVAIHAPRGGPHSLFAAVRMVLAPFHQQQRGTGDTAHTLYQPFLWRSLKVANQDVRANAVCLLSDAFPVLHSSMDREERDTTLQRQFDLFKDLLDDPSVTVRCAATAGVCRILGSYWELVPPPVIRGLLKRLLGDLARDASSVTVRVAVLQGLCVVLENRLTHPILKELLPLLANHIHDTSEKVRIALLDLLILVKGMKAIKFWEVVPVEDLLVRMELDSAPVAKRITSLLLDSFQPLDKGKQERLERCIALIRSNPSAARKFYQQAQKHLTLVDTARFMMAINTCLVQVVEGAGGDSGSGDEGEELSLQDTPIIAGLLEVLVILWEGARESLAKPSSKPVHSKLVTAFSSSVPLFFNAFNERPCHSALVLLAANLPHKAATSISGGFMELLKSFCPDTSTEEYGPMLVAMVTWKQSVPLLKLIGGWLEQGILATSGPTAVDGVNGSSDDSECPANCKKRQPEKGRRGRTGGGKGAAKPIAADVASLHRTKLALLYMKWMLAHPVCLHELVQVKQFWELKSILQKGLGGVEQLLRSSMGGAPVGREVCLDMFQLYWRLVLLQVTQSVVHDEACYCKDIQSLVVWCERECSHAMGQASLLEGQEGAGRLRKRKMAATAPPPELSERDETLLQVAQVALECFSECVLTGVFPLELRDAVSKMAAEWLSSPLGGRLLSHACKLLYQLNETLVEGTGKGGVSTGNEDLVRGILLITRKEMANRDQSSKSLSLVRPVLSACVDTSMGVYHLAEDPMLACPPVVGLLADSVLTDMEERLRTGPAAIAWPTTTDDMSDFSKGITQLISRGAETKSFFMSHLVSIMTKPKPDQDCADELLLYLAVLHVVMATLPMWKSKVASVTGLFSDITTFTDQLSDENVERLQDVVDLIRAGLQLAQDRLALFL